MRSFCITIGVFIFTLGFASQVWALPCSLVQVRSFDTITGQEKFGNGFAISADSVLINDHSLTADSRQIEVRVLESKTFARAKVIHRDFHTDLAILRVDNMNLQSCEIDTRSRLFGQERLQIVGSQKGSSTNLEVQVDLIDSASKKLKVPGVLNSLELKPKEGWSLNKGRSGSVVLSATGVVGILSQKTSEGTLLAIPSQVLQKRAEELQSGQLPKRKYKLDYSKGTISYLGLELQNALDIYEGLSNGGGNPHEGELKANTPISLEDYSLGYAVLLVKNPALLGQFEPKIAQALSESNASQLFVAAIDNITVRNELEFLRALEECKACRITRFWVKAENSENINSKNLRMIAFTTDLVSYLDKSDLNREFVAEAVARIKVFHEYLSFKQAESERGLVSTKTQEQVVKSWQHVEDHLDNIFQAEDLLNLLNQIRSEI